MKVSIIIPVYNEKNTILPVLSRVKDVAIDKEIIVVDDSSNDGTREILENLEGDSIKIFYHPENKGKGAAVRTAQKHVTGDVVIIQDADLEYQPDEYPKLIKPIQDGFADVVYGSRFLGTHRVFLVWHYFGNRFLTLLTNVLYNTMLSDMETGYKVFRAEVFKNLNIESNRFNFEAEVTAKIFKQDLRVVEAPITYYGRGYKEGKKIRWFDALPAVWVLFKQRFIG